MPARSQSCSPAQLQSDFQKAQKVLESVQGLWCANLTDGLLSADNLVGPFIPLIRVSLTCLQSQALTFNLENFPFSFACL